METLTMIRFKPVTIDAVPEICDILSQAHSRTCDYTVAGLLMWADYFHYEYAVVNGTLFVSGVTENDKRRSAFSMPIGDMSLGESVEMLADYCHSQGIPLRFSAVPEDCIDDFTGLGPCVVEELVDWADYLYNAGDLATLAGNKYSKKRNHVNRFVADHPGYTFETLTHDRIADVRRFFEKMHLRPDDSQETADVEREQTLFVLDHYDRLPFEGAILSTLENGIVAFTIGEVIGDTLYVHIEKMNHAVAGAGEAINKMFADMMLRRHGVAYINREEDVGDEGLRKAKLSYHPAMLLKKYNITFTD